MPSLTQPILEPRSHGTLNDYVTAIAWAPNHSLAIASAAGEVLLVDVETQSEHLLRTGDGQSIDCLAFSADSRYLAAGGQSGQLLIWSLQALTDPPMVLPHPRTWLDRLAWHPTRNSPSALGAMPRSGMQRRQKSRQPYSLKPRQCSIWPGIPRGVIFW